MGIVKENGRVENKEQKGGMRSIEERDKKKKKSIIGSVREESLEEMKKIKVKRKWKAKG